MKLIETQIDWYPSVTELRLNTHGSVIGSYESKEDGLMIFSHLKAKKSFKTKQKKRGVQFIIDCENAVNPPEGQLSITYTDNAKEEQQ